MTQTASPATVTKTGLIKSLVGIRGVLSFAVVLVHLAPHALLLAPAAAFVWMALWHNFYWALDMFFVLSGFVVTTGYRSRFGRWPGRVVYGRFLWARLSRFYPVHIVVLVALVAAVLASRSIGIELPHGGGLGWDLVRNVLLVQGWGWSDTLTWNGPTWSVSAEWFCYLAMPLIIPLVLRFRTSTAVVVAYVVAMAVPLVVYGIIGYGDPQITYLAPLWRAVGEFVGGALLCQLRYVGSGIPAALGRRTGPIFFLLVALLVGLSIAGVSLLFAVWLAGLLILGLAQEQGVLDRLLSAPRVLAAGELSVSLFLTHVPWLMVAFLIFTPERFPGAWGWLAIALIMAGAVGVAWLTYRFLEDPAQRWMAQLVRRGRHDAVRR